MCHTLGAWSMWASWCWKVTNVFVESATQSGLATTLTQLLQSLLVAGLVMAVFSRTVTRTSLRNTWSGLTPETMGQELRLARSPALDDEPAHAERGVNQLQIKPHRPPGSAAAVRDRSWAHPTTWPSWCYAPRA